ncbi:MAG TPA: four helix bundle protein [Kofleriaceae bacterium]|nr:four helix bundle protein [Kofleriaceae bacterium]
MLRIYPVCLAMVRDVRLLADRIGEFDRDQARQLRRSSVSVVLNVAEGAAVGDGRRRARYGDALGSARETVANLEAAEAIGYLAPIDAELRQRFDHIIGTLVRLVR